MPETKENWGAEGDEAPQAVFVLDTKKDMPLAIIPKAAPKTMVEDNQYYEEGEGEGCCEDLINLIPENFVSSISSV